MAKPKTQGEMLTVSFRCHVTLKEDLDALAASANCDVSSILIKLVGEVVAANKARILSFKAQAATPIILPTFATPAEPTPKKPARTPKKKKPAQVADSPTSDEVKAGDDVAENS